MAKQEYTTLRNSPSGDVRMPMFGLGTWRAEAERTRAAVSAAIRAGYRLIDTANDYGNEHAVGQAIQECIDEGIVKREDLFIQCKLWNGNMRSDLVELDLKASLKDLNVDYVDSYIIHWPMAAPADPTATKPTLAWNVVDVDVQDIDQLLDNSRPHNNNNPANIKCGSMFPVLDTGYFACDPSVHFTDSWKVMEKLVDSGLCRTIGISNFNIPQIMDLFTNGCEKYKPAVLQNEIHIYLQAKDILDFCNIHGIQLQAYSPLGSNPVGDRDIKNDPFLPKHNIREHPELVNMGKKYNGKSAPQIALKYQLQRGVSVVAKSENIERVRSNIDLFDFTIEEEDMKKVGAMNCSWRNLLWPQTAVHPDYPFKDYAREPAIVPEGAGPSSPS